MPVIDNAQPLVRDLFTEEAVSSRGGRPAAGMFLCSGDATTAEICAGAGMDYLLIDAEHAPLTLQDVLTQLRTIAGYRVPTMVRVPALDTVVIKQFLDLGAQTLLVPLVSTPEQAAHAVDALRYPRPRGEDGTPQDEGDGDFGGILRGDRGVGSALARSGRWNRIGGYLRDGDRHVSLFVQVETADGVANAHAIASTPGVDGVFVGPSDLSASMGLLGQQSHPDVVAAVKQTIEAVKAAGKIVGVNAFVQAQAEDYAAAGADFVNVGADVAILARGAEALADAWCPAAEGEAGGERASY